MYIYIQFLLNIVFNFVYAWGEINFSLITQGCIFMRFLWRLLHIVHNNHYHLLLTSIPSHLHHTSLVFHFYFSFPLFLFFLPLLLSCFIFPLPQFFLLFLLHPHPLYFLLAVPFLLFFPFHPHQHLYLNEF